MLKNHPFIIAAIAFFVGVMVTTGIAWNVYKQSPNRADNLIRQYDERFANSGDPVEDLIEYDRRVTESAKNFELKYQLVLGGIQVIAKLAGELPKQSESARETLQRIIGNFEKIKGLARDILGSQ